MHTCPICDAVCDCDMDDTWDLPVPDDCQHVCDDTDDGGYEDWFDEHWFDAEVEHD